MPSRLFALLCNAIAGLSLGWLGLALLHWVPMLTAPARLPLWQAILIDLALFGAFAVGHSVMARPAFKRRWTRVVPPQLERAVYMGVSGLSLLPLYLCWQPVGGTLWQFSSGLAQLLFALPLMAGLLLAAAALRAIDPLHFIGLRQAADPLAPEPQFARRGPYRWLRHPIQSGVLLMVWATPELTASHALLATLLSLYSVGATLGLEEHDLAEQIGEPYRRYQREVPALIPWRRRPASSD